MMMMMMMALLFILKFKNFHCWINLYYKLNTKMSLKFA